MATVRRLQQTLSHFQSPRTTQQLSIVQGPTEPALLDITLGELLTLQSLHYGDYECLVFPWTGARWTYTNLNDEADRLARGLLAMGIQKGDRIGIMAGNCEQYIAVFFAAARVGAILVVLNNTYTPSELYYALDHTDVRVLFMTPRIGRHSLEEVLEKMGPKPKQAGNSVALEEIVILRGEYQNFSTYNDVIHRGSSLPSSALPNREMELSPADVCNLQFTSGSTGNPKAAMLTHHNLVNNSRFIGDRMDLTSFDVLCCPPPLFHCFGLVLGMLAVVTHGSKIVFPSETFDPKAVLHAISDEKCTALHGVPTMFEAILALPKPPKFDTRNLRTGIIAGAPVPRPLMKRLFEELNMTQYTSSYGLTEASPTCFNALTTDTIETRLKTVGKVMPHARAKIIDAEGNIVPVGQRGELCIAGYQLTKGYWNNPDKTAETLTTDAEGTTWLKTGDEAIFTPEGYCTITGRFKDIIIRGGENIYPLEIEERLAAHPAIELASVIGVPDQKYGEVVGAFIAIAAGHEAQRPSVDELRNWTRETLGWHKAPQHVFVFGEEGIDRTVPVTGSGKVRKVDLRKVAAQVLEQRGQATAAATA
ncbi:putative long-chain-fatty-acid-CoA ligase [Aspergillus aculeatinus CBS 121060]|uniref:Acetyl-CoA synthetase-like protein n=2 Tax=Aspergillus TaxID=5052 RepID=A0A8G1RNE8_9EURO|nr:acetyl-CoA synthetase-like protein [Aspergillus aculeatinus CBS 121060]XP_040800500.1 acetyl-CoA synthetase-like protein [Aspergillus fijiensis CBS 313.89]RAH67105.1 acetyl-CoA synthetase-like protein [Aspergillus aculeatinus CBS 121060]RAK76490.1 acetyl-CoA synthetase-like protein [Aspergillus fijiensis CBS 313.89]